MFHLTSCVQREMSRLTLLQMILTHYHNCASEMTEFSFQGYVTLSYDKHTLRHVTHLRSKAMIKINEAKQKKISYFQKPQKDVTEFNNYVDFLNLKYVKMCPNCTLQSKVEIICPEIVLWPMYLKQKASRVFHRDILHSNNRK